VFSAISRITLLSGQTPSILDNIFIHPGTFYTYVFGFPGRCWYLLQSGRFDTSGGQELRGALGVNTRLICIFN
jgi:hypothetical protein